LEEAEINVESLPLSSAFPATNAVLKENQLLLWQGTSSPLGRHCDIKNFIKKLHQPRINKCFACWVGRMLPPVFGKEWKDSL
jgi:hypothetical protein